MNVSELIGNFPNAVIISAAVIAALGVIWRKVVAPVRGWFRSFKAWQARIETAVTWVDHQMKPNNGSSLVDKVNKTVDKVCELSANVALLLDHDAERDKTGRRYGPPQRRTVNEFPEHTVGGRDR